MTTSKLKNTFKRSIAILLCVLFILTSAPISPAERAALATGDTPDVVETVHFQAINFPDEFSVLEGEENIRFTMAVTIGAPSGGDIIIIEDDEDDKEYDEYYYYDYDADNGDNGNGENKATQS